jgi:hypothetical protein
VDCNCGTGLVGVHIYGGTVKGLTRPAPVLAATPAAKECVVWCGGIVYSEVYTVYDTRSGCISGGRCVLDPVRGLFGVLHVEGGLFPCGSGPGFFLGPVNFLLDITVIICYNILYIKYYSILIIICQVLFFSGCATL